MRDTGPGAPVCSPVGPRAILAWFHSALSPPKAGLQTGKWPQHIPEAVLSTRERCDPQGGPCASLGPDLSGLILSVKAAAGQTRVESWERHSQDVHLQRSGQCLPVDFQIFWNLRHLQPEILTKASGTQSLIPLIQAPTTWHHVTCVLSACTCVTQQPLFLPSPAYKQNVIAIVRIPSVIDHHHHNTLFGAANLQT